MRGDWDKKIAPVAPSQDLSNYILATSNGFKISNPSASTSKMVRRVNLIPYKEGDSIKWRKRPGCKSTTSVEGSSVVDATSSAASVLYISGVSSSSASVLTSSNGSTWAQQVIPAVTSGALSITQGLPTGGVALQYMSEINISGTTYMVFSLYVSAGNTQAYYISETDVTAATKGPYSSTCSGTLGNGIITGIGSTAKFAAGQVVYLDGLVGGGSAGFTSAIITSVDSGTQVTLNLVNPFDTGAQLISKGAFYQITDTDFPGNSGNDIVGKFASMNGYLYIMCKNGRIYNSDINSISSWTATGYITAQMMSDYGVTLSVYKNHIMAFGERSIEFFRDVGNATGSPLQSVPELFIRMGTRNGRHVAQVEDSLFFVANTNEGSNSIYVMDGFQPRKISTDDIDYVISKIGPTNFELKALRLNGKLCLLVNRVATSTSQEYVTFVYYVEEGEWGEWKVTEGGTATDYTHPWQFPMGSISSTFYSVSAYQATNGVYVSTFLSEADDNYYDNLAASSKNVTVYIQTPVLTMGTLNRKFLKELRLLDSTSSLLNPGSAVTVYWSDDYGVTWTSRTFASTKQFLSNLGYFRERIFRIVEASNDFYQIGELELLYKQGNH